MIAAKKLIEVVLPLGMINYAAADEKMPGIATHPGMLSERWKQRSSSTAESGEALAR